jgi:acyl-CoA synthetase (AMP-forming)/AMP-acid ligase II
VLKISAQQISQLANPGYLYDELVHHIKDSRPRVLVVGKSVFDVAKKAAVECGIDDYNIYIMEEDDHEQYKSIWSLAGKEELEPRRLSPQEANQRTAFMCYSSGTTGKAKGGITFYSLTSPSYLSMTQWRLPIIISRLRLCSKWSRSLTSTAKQRDGLPYCHSIICMGLCSLYFLRVSHLLPCDGQAYKSVKLFVTPRPSSFRDSNQSYG